MPKKLFKPGQSGNPSGRPKLPRDILEAKQMNTIEFTRLMNRFMSMSREQLSDFTKNPAATTLELLISSIVAKAITNGDHQRAEFLITRLVGKVADQVNSAGMIKIVIEDYSKK